MTIDQHSRPLPDSSALFPASATIVPISFRTPSGDGVAAAGAARGLRVLTFLHSFEPGGVERIALRMVRQWRRTGVDAPLFLGREDGALRTELAQDLDYEVARQPRVSTASWETLWMILQLPGVIRRLRPDVLFVAGSTYTIVAVMMRLLLGRDCPPIVTKISNDLARRDLPPVARAGWRLWLWLQARLIHRWVLMDESMAPEMPRAMAARSVVVHDPALDRRSDPAPRLREAVAGRRFVAVGRLVHQKDFSLMLRGFAAGARADDTLTIYGDGPERAELATLSERLGLTSRVTFAGHVPDAASRLGDYDVLLMSSRYEGIPAVLLEALDAGLAVISTDCGAGVRSLLGHGRFGRVVARSDAAFAAAVAEAVPTPAPAAELDAHLARFTVDRAATGYFAAFVEAAHGDRATAPLPIATMPRAA